MREVGIRSALGAVQVPSFPRGRNLHHHAGGREGKRDDRSRAGASSSGPASRPCSAAATVQSEGEGADREQQPAGFPREGRPGGRGLASVDLSNRSM